MRRRALDVACGSGRATRELARRGARVTGVGIRAGMLARDAASSPIRPRVGPTTRTLATYLNALTVRGLAIGCVREPVPPARWLAGEPTVPAYLVLSADRTG